jgi:hypothetical protein
MCRYDHQIFRNTLSSSALTYGSLCGMYSRNSSRLIFLKSSPQCGSVVLVPVFSYVSSKAGGWIKTFFVDVLMTGSNLGVYSNYFSTPGEEPSPISSSFNFNALDDCLVVSFLGDIVPAIEINLLETTYIATLDNIYIYEV